MKLFPKRRLSFRAKLSIYGATVGSISLLLAIAVFLVNEEVGYRASFSDRARTEADIVRTACASAVVFQDPDFAKRSLAGLEGSADVVAAAVYSSDGTLMASYFRTESEAELPGFPPAEEQFFTGSSLSTTLPISFRSQQVGWIYLRSELPGYGPRLRMHALISVGVMLISLLISMIVASFLQNPITGPVAELQAAAQAMAGGKEPSVQARKLADDELGDLTDSMNEMFQRIVARENELRESRQRFSGLLDRLGEAVFRMGVPTGVFEYCSPAARGVFGYPASEFLARPRILEDIVHPEDRSFLKQELARLESGDITPAWEYRILDPGGHTRWIYQTNSITRSDAGHVIALESCCTDITVRRQASDEKRRLEAELAQAHKLEALGNLAGGIAHDFNNLLGAIVGYTDLAAMDLAPDHPVQDSLTHIAQATERATGLTGQILSFSRRSDTGRVPIDVGRMTRDAMDLMRATLPATIRIRTDIDQQVCVAHANANELHRVIMNLCTNAGHAMDGLPGDLTVRLRPVELIAGDRRLGTELNAGPYAEISVTDTGHGIPMEIRDRIFEPFFTTKKSGHGTGMGLSVAYGIIRDHGGAINVQSRQGAGTTFSILLPVVQEEVRTRPAETRDSRTEGGRVLFVDDEELLVALAKRALKTKGFQVEAYTQPRRALDAFRKAPNAYDVVMTDLTMPLMTGLELAREILALRPDIPIVLCSGFAEESTRSAAHEVGIHGIATKPLKVNQIDELIQAALLGQPLPET